MGEKYNGKFEIMVYSSWQIKTKAAGIVEGLYHNYSDEKTQRQQKDVKYIMHNLCMYIHTHHTNDITWIDEIWWEENSKLVLYKQPNQTKPNRIEQNRMGKKENKNYDFQINNMENEMKRVVGYINVNDG